MRNLYPTVPALDAKQSARAATTANLPALSGLLTVDGVLLAAGDRVLVKDQNAPAQNGIYVARAGAWPRAADARSGAELGPGATVAVQEGDAQADTRWVLSTDGPVTVGTTSLVFASAGGEGAPGSDYAAAYLFGGGAHDYEADAEYAPAALAAASEGAVSSGVLGDGDSAPFFVVYATDKVQNLTRTVGGGLRMEFITGQLAADGWPAADAGPNLSVPLPTLDSVTVEATLLSNAPAVGTGASHRVRLGLLRPTGTNAMPTSGGCVFLEGVNAARVNEQVSGAGGAEVQATTDRTAFVANGVYRRRYRFVRTRAGTVIYAETARSSGVLALVGGVSAPKRCLSPADEIFNLWVGTGNGAGAPGLYAEIQNLTVAGTYR